MSKNVRLNPARERYGIGLQNQKGMESNMKKAITLALALALGVSFAAQAADQLVQFKAGDIAMTVLDSDGVSPLADASIKMLSPEDNSILTETVSDDFGKAVIKSLQDFIAPPFRPQRIRHRKRSAYPLRENIDQAAHHLEKQRHSGILCVVAVFWGINPHRHHKIRHKDREEHQQIG